MGIPSMATTPVHTVAQRWEKAKMKTVIENNTLKKVGLLEIIATYIFYDINILQKKYFLVKKKLILL